MTRPTVVLLGVFTIALTGGSAQQRRHTMTHFDTVGGKTVIELYSHGVLDTFIVMGDKATSKSHHYRRQDRSKPIYEDHKQAISYNNSSKSRSGKDGSGDESIERLMEEAKRLAKDYERYR